MAIFSRKSKSKESGTTSKQSTNGLTEPNVEQYRGVPNGSGPTQSQNGAPISPAERTAQRAALMAASRKQMNVNNPSYSVNGSFVDSPKPMSSASNSSQPVLTSDQAGTRSKSARTPHKTLTKPRKSNEDSRRRKGSAPSAPNNVPAPGAIAGATMAHRSAPSSIRGGVEKRPSMLGDMFQKTPPLPMDSPTLGHTANRAGSSGEPVISHPSADSGYGTQNSIHGFEESTARNAKAPLPRVDSGIMPKDGMESSSSHRTLQENKTLIGIGLTKAGGYVSRLDPGPTNSDFAAPVPFSNPSDIKMVNSPSSTSKQSKQRRPSYPDQHRDRGRSTAQKPLQTPASPISPPLESPQPQFAHPARSVSSASREQYDPKTYFVQRVSSSKSQSQSPGSNPYAQPPTTARTWNIPVSKSSVAERPSKRTSHKVSGREASSETSRFADGATLNALHGSSTVDSARNSIDPHARQAPKAVPISQSISSPAYSPAIPASNHQAAASSGSNESVKPAIVPPLSVLEGYKVNKRGQVLDEEGDVIGELFEGDLIDCVRQRINAEGEVLDEYGSIVGRVRPVRRGASSAIRSSIDSQQSSFQSNPVQRQSVLPVDRRESVASQLASPHTAIAPSKGLANALATKKVVSPMDTPKAFIAELDASVEAEAFPVIDHSEIFLPPFGSSTRSQSPSQLMKAELPDNERRPSMSSVASEDANASDRPRPKKWASRYFDQGGSEPASPSASRRNSQSPAARPILKPESQQTSRRNSQATAPPAPSVRIEPKAAPRVPPSPTTSYTAPGSYKAVLGPTLEDLVEEPPSRSISQSSKAGKSTPNLLSESSRLSTAPATQGAATGARRASLQMGSLNGTLSPNNARASYQPLRRSPLGSYGKRCPSLITS
jgi:hypothetical protein